MFLSQVIAQVESSNNQRAMRFEPVSFQNKPLWISKQIQKIQHSHGGFISYDTALQIACTSYGLYQILGANIYGCGYTHDIFDFVALLPDQNSIFYEFLRPEGFEPSENVNEWSDNRFVTFANFYNGPGDVAAYVDFMKKAAGIAA